MKEILPAIKLVIPDDLSRWIYAYHRTSESEWNFHLRNVPVRTVRIGVCKTAGGNHYRAECGLAKKNSPDDAEFQQPVAISASPGHAVIEVLSQFISGGNLWAFQERKYSWHLSSKNIKYESDRGDGIRK